MKLLDLSISLSKKIIILLFIQEIGQNVNEIKKNTYTPEYKVDWRR